MKKLSLLMIGLVASLLTVGCAGNGGGSTSGDSSSGTITTGEPSTPRPADQHVTGITMSPSKSFVCQVNQTISFKVSHEGNPTDQTEKAVTWKVSDESLASITLVDTSGGYYQNADITFLDTGKITVTVTSNYNYQLTRSVDVKVVKNDNYTYLWNCSTNDKNKFSSINDQLPIPQVIEDDVELNNKTWHVKRHAAETNVSGSQNLRFGYGEKEGQLDFTLVNDKTIETIEIGVSSRAKVIGIDDDGYEIRDSVGSSKLTVKVGEVVYLNKADTPKGDTPEAVTTPELIGYSSGNISISLSESVGYIYIQYIYIKYLHELDGLSLDTSHCKTTFELGDEFTSEGLIAKAIYTNDPEQYDVSSFVEVREPDLSNLGTKRVEVSYKEGNIQVQTSYDITIISPRELDIVVLDGAPIKTTYFVNDEMDYSGLYVVATYKDGSSETLPLPTQDYGDFSEVNVPQYADLFMNEEWSISLKYKGQLLEKTFEANLFNITASKIVFDMSLIQLDDYNEYIDIQDSLNLVNMHVAAKNTENTGNYPTVYNKHNIVFTTLDNNTVFSSFKFEFAPYISSGASGKTDSGTILVKESILKAAPFSNQVGSTSFTTTDEENKTIECSNLAKGCNALEISFSNSNHFGLVSFEFEISSVENAIIENITYEGELSKKTYELGEKFSPKGLTFYVNFANDYARQIINEPETYIVWEDLNVGDIVAIGHFLNLTVEVSGITVNGYEGKTYTKVTSDLEDLSGTYLITCIANDSIWNGSLSSTEDIKGNNFYNVTFDEGKESIKGDYNIDNSTFTIVKQESGNYLLFSHSGIKCGLTNAGGLQALSPSSSAKHREVSISIDVDGNLIITNEGIEETKTIKQIGCSQSTKKYSTFAVDSSSDCKIQLFKQL